MCIYIYYIYIYIYLHIVDMMSMNAQVHSTSTRALNSVIYSVLISHLFVVNSDAMAPPKLHNRCMNEDGRDVQRSAAAAAADYREQHCAFITIIARHRRRLMLQPSVGDHNLSMPVKALERLEQQAQQARTTQQQRHYARELSCARAVCLFFQS